MTETRDMGWCLSASRLCDLQRADPFVVEPDMIPGVNAPVLHIQNPQSYPWTLNLLMYTMTPKSACTKPKTRSVMSGRFRQKNRPAK